MLTVATANVNGIRAADRRGMTAWLTRRHPDVLLLQEVRAPDECLADALGPGWSGVHAVATAKGRAGVAVMSRTSPAAVRVDLPPAAEGAAPHAAEDTDAAAAEGTDARPFVGTGRWAEADLVLDGAPGLLTLASVYVHKGETGTARQEEKYRFLAAVRDRMRALAADGRHVLVGGDINIAHREDDLKNWRANRAHAGFLPRERAWFDDLLGGDGFVDVQRALVGPGPGPYSWWSWRGQAFDTDAGWRIDYHLASPGLAALARSVAVDKAETYAARWSDHAPVLVEYDVTVCRTPRGTGHDGRSLPPAARG